MSHAESQTALGPDGRGCDDHDDEVHGLADAPHGTIRDYLTGFCLAVVLTAIPFWLVMGEVLATPSLTALVILLLGAVQIVVHVVYFLHMKPSSEQGWNLMAFVFTLILVIITMTGSLWIMYNLHQNMMPGIKPTATQSS